MNEMETKAQESIERFALWLGARVILPCRYLSLSIIVFSHLLPVASLYGRRLNHDNALKKRFILILKLQSTPNKNTLKLL